MRKILILAANPKDTSQLRLDQEVREIDGGLQRAQRRDEFTLKQQWAARPKDVRRAMLDFKPNVVHFCGHGAVAGGIALEDETGHTKSVSAEALAGFFELFADTVECVVLNACYSGVQAEAIAKHIAYVVGMKEDIGDDAAIEFAVAFYDALGAGESIEFAYRLACNAIQLAGIPEHLTPILKLKSAKSMGRDEVGFEAEQSSNTRLTAIVFDESYRQSEWYGRPTMSLGYSRLAEEISQSFNVISHKSGYSSQEALPSHGILVLPTPFGTMVDESEYEQISHWVYTGGRLLAFGIYLMEGHHFSNFNQLLRHFGIEFSHNLMMPIGKESFQDCMRQAFAYVERDLWVITQPYSRPKNHPIMEGISELAVPSSCTVACAADAELCVSTSESVAIMQAMGFKDSSGRLLQIRDYVLNKHDQAMFMVALPYGSGKVVGVGTWKIFLNELVQAYPDGNGRLFHNIMSWLKPNA